MTINLDKLLRENKYSVAELISKLIAYEFPITFTITDKNGSVTYRITNPGKYK